ncbi:EAL domain-containing protein [Oscillibacter sp.]|uniref:EAL domain-containing protein n=1 Tax=Oscillibacter sp. TaxID=1945593 RepID=UPI00262A1109|nr:EAL domain-containing protein [Oscillibacter sp.]MDD3347829.1 EAL domain-containing protein [Oscillibacter sp.]
MELRQVLIVEDSLVNRTLLHKLLQDDYLVVEAANGKEALSIIQECHQNLAAVILDLRMPVMDGFELMERLSLDGVYGNLPIIVATGENDEELESRCLKLGAWDFVTKPYNPSVLRLRLHNVIGRSQLQLMDRIRRLAERDELTGLYNRSHFMKQTKKMILEHPERTYALIRMDIDHFRLFNASFGSEAGDALLIAIANGIKRDTTREQVYGRIESDVFCICTPYHPGELEEHCKRSVENGRTMHPNFVLKFAFGIYIITNPELNMEKMYSFATEAAEKCKHNLNAICGFYDAEMEQKEMRAQQISSEIDRAIKDRQFQVYLQPKYSLLTKEPCGAEALIRWSHPQRGLISPGEFIPVIEQNGLILEVDQYMWEQVCMLLRKWMDRLGHTTQPVSVNVSRVSLYNPHLVQHLVDLTERYQITRDLLQLEITESAYMSDPDLMKETIANLRTNGFTILMDDFGCGYSSLNTLKEIDVDILKVDMKFLPVEKNDVKSEKILASVLKMAHWLGLPVIVEGVETREQKDFLESVGCRYVQGYYFAKPMPVEAYEVLLAGFAQLEDAKDIPESSANMDALLASDSKIGMLLKSVAVPFAIMDIEYAHQQANILRMNPAYMQTFQAETNMQKLLQPEELDKLRAALEETAATRKSAECECLFLMPNSVGRWYRLHLSYIETTPTASLVSATFTDVTAERMLENEVHSVLSTIKAPSGQKSRILVVEDSEISQELLKTMFCDEFDVLAALNGKEGLEELEKYTDSIALILLDMFMPVMDGFEFLAKKNAMPAAANIPVVVISLDVQETTQLNMLRNGVNDYVTKPFVPELMKKRVHNVLEYSSRFRTLVQEYRQSIHLENAQRLLTPGYSSGEVRTMLSFLTEVFDVVRLVDPSDTAVITIHPDGTLQKAEYTCFQVWGKERRCDNCSSMCAKQGRCVLSKYELIQNDIFYVMSRPIQIYLPDGKEESLVLEVVSCVTGEAGLCECGENNIHEMLERTHAMIYSDPLTGVYNRRYLDELLFLHHGQNSVAKQVGFVLLDLYDFKSVNNVYGHLVGDQVLVQLAENLKTCIRDSDSIIRMGGDEFIVAFTNCEEDTMPAAVERLRQSVEEVFYGREEQLVMQADFGYAYTADFAPDTNQVERLLKQADAMMYANKKQHHEEESGCSGVRPN